MSAEKAQGLVIRTIDFGETSCVVTFFTREFGRVTGLAKGAFRPKGPFDAALDLLNECRLVFLRKSPSALNLITEAKLERRFRPAEGRLSHLHAAYYLTELLQELTVEDDGQPEFYDAAVQALGLLARPTRAARCVLWFETRLLRALGRLPDLDCCVECGDPLPAEGRIAFGRHDGGPLCNQHRLGKRSVVSLSHQAFQFWNLLAAGDASTQAAWIAAQEYTAAAGELRGMMNQLMNHLLGMKPKTQQLIPADIDEFKKTSRP